MSVFLDEGVKVSRRATLMRGPAFEKSSHVVIGERLHPDHVRHYGAEVLNPIAMLPTRDDDTIAFEERNLIIAFTKLLYLGSDLWSRWTDLIKAVEHD